MRIILNFFLSLINIIKINFLVLKFKFFKSNKKIIFIYHPSNTYDLNSKKYLDDLFDNFENNYLIINAHKKNNLEKRNYFFLNYDLMLNWIFYVDIFFSHYICDKFTKNSIRIYMHHDIYDTPLVSEDKKKELFKRVIKYNYLFLPNKISLEMFKKFLSKYNDNPHIAIPKLIETGYLKLDYLNNRRKTYKISRKDSIVIAPTNFIAFPELSIESYLEELISLLIDKTKYNIVYRPHPSNRNHSKTLKIIKKFETHKKFFFDNSSDYFESYLKSNCMITDLSGTAYTYAFFVKQPVIFFSKNENLIKKLNYHELSCFKDRDKIGLITKNTDQVLNTINNIESIKSNLLSSINILEKEMLYLNSSQLRIKNLIENICYKTL